MTELLKKTLKVSDENHNFIHKMRLDERLENVNAVISKLIQSYKSSNSK